MAITGATFNFTKTVTQDEAPSASQQPYARGICLQVYDDKAMQLLR